MNPEMYCNTRPEWISQPGRGYPNPRFRTPVAPRINRGAPFPYRGGLSGRGMPPMRNNLGVYHRNFRSQVSQANEMPPPPLMRPPMRPAPQNIPSRGRMYPVNNLRGSYNPLPQHGYYPVRNPVVINRKGFPRRNRRSFTSRARGTPAKRPALAENRVVPIPKPMPTNENPSDPLDLGSLIEGNNLRAAQGLSPLPGDSTVNTPCVSEAGDTPIIQVENSAPIRQQNVEITNPRKRKPDNNVPWKNQFMNKRARGKRGWHNPRNYKRGKHVATRGDYRQYYTRRDPSKRLEYFMADWFNGKVILDYGCNTGRFTLSLFEKFPDISRLDAIDCSPPMIEAATHKLTEKIRCEEVWSVSRNRDAAQVSIDYNKVKFQVADWAHPQETVFDTPEYDCVLALSVTKWIHLRYGDEGLMRFFRRIFNRIKPGGHLLIEPQNFRSYKRHLKKNELYRSNYKEMRINPANIREHLTQAGFCYYDDIRVGKSNEPFCRTIIFCTKSNGMTPRHIRDSAVRAVYRLPRQPEEPERDPNDPPPLIYRGRASEEIDIFNSDAEHSVQAVSRESTPQCVSSTTGGNYQPGDALSMSWETEDEDDEGVQRHRAAEELYESVVVNSNAAACWWRRASTSRTTKVESTVESELDSSVEMD